MSQTKEAFKALPSRPSNHALCALSVCCFAVRLTCSAAIHHDTLPYILAPHAERTFRVIFLSLPPLCAICSSLHLFSVLHVYVFVHLDVLPTLARLSEMITDLFEDVSLLGRMLQLSARPASVTIHPYISAASSYFFAMLPPVLIMSFSVSFHVSRSLWLPAAILPSRYTCGGSFA